MHKKEFFGKIFLPKSQAYILHMSYNSIQYGIGLRSVHYEQMLQIKPTLYGLEIHSDNFFHEDSYVLDILLKLRESYNISLHGVGMSLGSYDRLNKNYLVKLKQLIDRIDPFLVSEHISWSYANGIYLPDLMPLPYTQESMEVVSRNVHEAQDFLGRSLLLENISSYVSYQSSNISEASFINQLCSRTGSYLLLDLNNVYVSCKNHKWCMKSYIQKLDLSIVKEIHLAGHQSSLDENGQPVLIDTHDNHVSEEVLELYRYTMQQIALLNTKETASNAITPIFVVLEWDANLPPVENLIIEIEHIKNQECKI